MDWHTEVYFVILAKVPCAALPMNLFLHLPLHFLQKYFANIKDYLESGLRFRFKQMRV